MSRNPSVVRDFKALRASEGEDCCEVCHWRPPRALREVAGKMIDRLLQAHHIHPVACSGSDSAENLILLCPNHHAIAHHIGRMYRIKEGQPLLWCGPHTRKDFLFTMTMLSNRVEYARFAAVGHRVAPYLAMLETEAAAEHEVEEIRRNRAFTVIASPAVVYGKRKALR